jgi:hypothetical protein
MEHKDTFALPEVESNSLPYTDRNLVAAQVTWLEQQQIEGEPMILNAGHDHYRDGPWYDNHFDQEYYLPEDKSWIMERHDENRLSLPTSSEWNAIFALVAQSTYLEAGSLLKLHQRTFRTEDESSELMKQVENFTVPATAEAIAVGETGCFAGMYD